MPVMRHTFSEIFYYVCLVDRNNNNNMESNNLVAFFSVRKQIPPLP